MNSSKAAIVINTIIGKVLSIIGYTLGAMFILATFGQLSDMHSEGAVATLIVCLIFISLCLIPIIKGIQIKNRIKRFRIYVGLISIEHMTSIEDISNSTSQSVDFVRNDIQKMIDKKFFANAYIDTRSDKIIIGKSIEQSQLEFSDDQDDLDFDADNEFDIDINVEIGIEDEDEKINNNKIKNENVKCPGCGAMSLKRKNEVIHCEYCGSAI